MPGCRRPGVQMVLRLDTLFTERELYRFLLIRDEALSCQIMLAVTNANGYTPLHEGPVPVCVHFTVSKRGNPAFLLQTFQRLIICAGFVAETFSTGEITHTIPEPVE